MKHINYSPQTYEKLIKATDLIGKVNTQLSKMKNPYLLTYLLESIDTISSNEVENIHTTVDEAFDDLITNNNTSPYILYRETLKTAHKKLQINEIIRSQDLEWINSRIRNQKIGFRKTPVSIKNSDGAIIHEGTPANKINQEIADLIKYINDDWDMNPILKALLIHHKFENIHPFTDGNGRTGRILFALLLNKYEVLNIPASVFSYSVLRKKEVYYEALAIADKKEYDKYLQITLGILNESLEITLSFIKKFQEKINLVLSIDKVKESKNLLKIIPWCFAGVKVSIKYLMKKTGLNNKTLTKYLKILEDYDVMKKESNGKYKPYKNLIIEKLINDYFS